MTSITPARSIALVSIFTALCVLLQSAPVFLPGIGLMISPLSTLPIMVAAAFAARLGVWILLCSAAILFFISPEEALVFLLATGSFGLALGTFIHKGTVTAALLSGSVLCIGITALTYLVGFAAFGDLTSGYPFYFTISLYLFFSILYAFLWVCMAKRFLKRIV